MGKRIKMITQYANSNHMSRTGKWSTINGNSSPLPPHPPLYFMVKEAALRVKKKKACYGALGSPELHQYQQVRSAKEEICTANPDWFAWFRACSNLRNVRAWCWWLFKKLTQQKMVNFNGLFLLLQFV